jgi:hypothetical protein
MTGIAEVAQVVFVRKSLVDVQYLRTTITNEQRQEFGRMVEDTTVKSRRRIFRRTVRSAFPRILAAPAALARRPGADNLDWLDELNY